MYAPDETDVPAPERIMTFFAEARAFLNASLSDDGGIWLDTDMVRYRRLNLREVGPAMFNIHHRIIDGLRMVM